MPFPQKTCEACEKKSSAATKVCACGQPFKSKTKRNWAGTRIPPKSISKVPSTGRPRGRPPKGKKWDAEKKEWVDESKA
jgi:hypothetical protein